MIQGDSPCLYSSDAQSPYGRGSVSTRKEIFLHSSHPCRLAGVLVRSAMTDWVAFKHLFLTVLAAGKSKIKAQGDLVSGRACFLVHR